jgi:hypothetical protein
MNMEALNFGYSMEPAGIQIQAEKLELKGREQWERRGVGKVENDRYWSRTVVIDVCLSLFSRHLVLNLFPFPLSPAQLLGDCLLIKGRSGAANC